MMRGGNGVHGRPAQERVGLLSAHKKEAACKKIALCMHFPAWVVNADTNLKNLKYACFVLVNVICGVIKYS